jgi:hypothetical protein
MVFFLKYLSLSDRLEILNHLNGIDLINLWQAVGTDTFTQTVPQSVIEKEIFPLAPAFSDIDVYDRRAGEQCIYVWDKTNIEVSLFIFIALTRHRCCNENEFYIPEYTCCCTCGWFAEFYCSLHIESEHCRFNYCENYHGICDCGASRDCNIRIGDKSVRSYDILDTFLNAKRKVYKTNIYFYDGFAHLIKNYISFYEALAVARSKGYCSPNEYKTREFQSNNNNITFKMFIPTVYLNFDKQDFDANIVRNIFPDYKKPRIVIQDPRIDVCLTYSMTCQYTRLRKVNSTSKHHTILYQNWIHSRDIKSPTGEERTRFPPCPGWGPYVYE